MSKKLSKIPKRGLGKGLQALIPEVEEEKKDAIEINIKEIFPNKYQPRKEFDQDKLEELATSIKQHGVIQPIIISPKNRGYQIVAGERRWRAASMIDLEKIPAIIKEFSERQIMEIALIENLQREDLNIMEEARAFKDLIDQFNLTQEEIGERLGKSRTAITNTLRLLNLSKGLQKYISNNQLSAGHGRTLLSVKDENKREILAQKVISEGLSVRELESLVKKPKEEKKQELKKSNKKSPLIVDLEDELQKTLGTKVTISHKKNKGKIEIEYYSNEDLDRLLEFLK